MSLRQTALFLVALLMIGGLTACDKPEDKMAKYIQRGNALFEQKDFTRARLEYKNAARIAPTSAEVRYRLALVDEAEGNIGGAIKGLLAAEQQNPHYAPALAKLAQYLLTAGELEAAQQRVDVLLTDAPTLPQALALRAAIRLRQNKLQEAEQDVRAALQNAPDNVLATSVLTGLFAARGDQARALETVETGLVHAPKDLSLLMLRVMLHAKTGDMQKMAAAYAPIFQAYPQEARFRFDLADAWLKAGAIDAAEATLREAAAALPQNQQVAHRLYLFLAEHRGLEAAEMQLKAYMAQNPGQGDGPFWLADLYIKNNETDKAVALLETIARQAEEQPQGLNARTTLARLYLHQGYRDTAEKLVAYVLASDPDNTDALFVRARLAFEDGRLEQAAVDLRHISQNKNAAPKALLLLAETLFKQGRLDLATDSLVQLLTMDPTDQKARVRLAQFYNLQGDVKRAQTTIALVGKMDPSYAVGWESAVRLAIDAKDWPRAQSALERLEKIEGQELTALFLRAQIQAQTDAKTQAAQGFRRILETAPQAPLAEHALRAYIQLEATPAHLKEVSAFAATLDLRAPALLTLQGQALALQGKLDEAAAFFDRAIAAGPSSQDPYVERAKIDLAKGAPDQAATTLREAMQKTPADMRAPFLLADIMMAQKKTDEAIRLYEDLLARNPAMDLAANNLAQLYADERASDERAMDRARQLAERFLASANPYFLDTLGWVYLRAGQISQAAPVLDRVAALLPEMMPQMHYHQGVLRARQGRMQEARESLGKATAIESRYPGFEEAKKLLATLP